MARTANSVSQLDGAKLIVGYAGEASLPIEKVGDVSVFCGVPTSVYRFDGEFDLIDLTIQARFELREFVAYLECGDEVHPSFAAETAESFAESECVGAVVYDTVVAPGDYNRIVFKRGCFAPHRDFLGAIPSRYIIVHIPKVLTKCSNPTCP